MEKMGARSLAELVPALEQAPDKVLVLIDCREMQGYFFGAPRDAQKYSTTSASARSLAASTACAIAAGKLSRASRIAAMVAA